MPYKSCSGVSEMPWFAPTGTRRGCSNGERSPRALVGAPGTLVGSGGTAGAPLWLRSLASCCCKAPAPRTPAAPARSERREMGRSVMVVSSYAAGSREASGLWAAAPVVSLVNSQEGAMTRLRVVAALSVTIAACSLDVAPLNTPKIILTPVLDSLFVGDLLVKRQLTFVDSHGNVQDPGVVTWSTSDTSVIAVDSLTGKITGRNAGLAVLYADAQNAEGFAVTVVSPPLRVTLLVDTIFLMPGDTFFAPVEVVHQAPGTPLVWFSATASAAVTADSATGLVT